MAKPSYDVFIDSDAFMALLLPSDDQHADSVRGFERIQRERLVAVTSELVISEAASVLSKRFDLSYAKQYLSFVRDFLFVDFHPEDREATVALFLEQTKKKTSFVDMSNVILMKRHQVSHIFSFDSVYTNDFGLKPFL